MQLGGRLPLKLLTAQTSIARTKGLSVRLPCILPICGSNGLDFLSINRQDRRSETVTFTEAPAVLRRNGPVCYTRVKIFNTARTLGQVTEKIK